MVMRESELKQNRLKNRLQGMVDSRSMKGMLSRGKNVYKGGSPQATMGSKMGLGRPAAGPADALSRLEQARDLANKAREASVQVNRPNGPTTPPPGMQNAQNTMANQMRQLSMQQGQQRAMQPVGQVGPQLPAQAAMQAQESLKSAMMRRLQKGR